MGLWNNLTHAVNWTFGALSDGIFGPAPTKATEEPKKDEKPSNGKSLSTEDSAVRYRTPSTPGTRKFLKKLRDSRS